MTHFSGTGVLSPKQRRQMVLLARLRGERDGPICEAKVPALQKARSANTGRRSAVRRRVHATRFRGWREGRRRLWRPRRPAGAPTADGGRPARQAPTRAAAGFDTGAAPEGAAATSWRQRRRALAGREGGNDRPQRRPTATRPWLID